MSFVFGGRPGKQDPELAKAAQRRREAFARDIGDEHGRAFAHELPRGRRRWSGVVGLVLLLFAIFGAIPLLRGSEGGLVSRQCDQPALGVSAGSVPPGSRAAWQAAGPDRGQYVVALDSAAVVADGSTVASPASGRVLAGPFRLADCRSAQTLFDAPDEPGRHEVTLFRRTTANYVAVATQTITVS